MLIFSSLRGIVESKKDGHAMLILCAVMKHSIKVHLESQEQPASLSSNGKT